MQNKLNKKAVAAVVTIVLLILISMIAISLLWVSIIKPKTNLSPLPCTIQRINQLVSIEEVCYIPEESTVVTTLKRGFTNTEVRSLEFSLSLEDQRLNYICDGPYGNSCGTTCIPPEQPGSMKKFYLSIDEEEQIPNSLTIKANGCTLERAEIPIC